MSRMDFTASSVLDEKLDCRREAVPTLELARQLLPALRRQRIELRGAPQIGFLPRGADPALILQPVQRRVQGPLAHGQSFARERLDPLRYAPAMQRLTSDGLEDQ